MHASASTATSSGPYGTFGFDALSTSSCSATSMITPSPAIACLPPSCSTPPRPRRGAGRAPVREGVATIAGPAGARGTTMTDLVIRGGMVVDGTGRPAFRADVRTAGGRIVEVGERLDPSGAQQLDAGGAVISPGFIDSHTHLDPSMFWDPLCDPMPQHGVTTALVGNCSLGLVPVRPDLVAGVTDVFCYIEDMPPR